MKNQLVLSVIGLVAVLALGLTVYQMLTKPKVAYVRSQVLVYEYAGTNEVRAAFEALNKNYRGQ